MAELSFVILPSDKSNVCGPYWWLVSIGSGMAWCHQATSHYLSQCWSRSLSLYDVIRPHWADWDAHCVIIAYHVSFNWFKIVPLINFIVDMLVHYLILSAVYIIPTTTGCPYSVLMYLNIKYKLQVDHMMSELMQRISQWWSVLNVRLSYGYMWIRN